MIQYALIAHKIVQIVSVRIDVILVHLIALLALMQTLVRHANKVLHFLIIYVLQMMMLVVHASY